MTASILWRGILPRGAKCPAQRSQRPQNSRSKLASRLHSVIGVFGNEREQRLQGAGVVFVVQVLLAGCAPRLIQLSPNGQSLLPLAAGQPLEVVVTVAGGVDPLPVSGERVIYGGLADAVSRSILSAGTTWGQRHRLVRAGGWQMLVEIVRSNAEVQAGRLTVEVETRVTFRGTLGQVHLGQTYGYCKEAEVLAGGDGSRV